MLSRSIGVAEVGAEFAGKPVISKSQSNLPLGSLKSSKSSSSQREKSTASSANLAGCTVPTAKRSPRPELGVLGSNAPVRSNISTVTSTGPGLALALA
jgi:hypothetical protein